MGGGRYRLAPGGGFRGVVVPGGKPQGRVRDAAVCTATHASRDAAGRKRRARCAAGRAGRNEPFPYPRTDWGEATGAGVRELHLTAISPPGGRRRSDL